MDRKHIIAVLVGVLAINVAHTWPGDRIDRHAFFVGTRFAASDVQPDVAVDAEGDIVTVWASLDHPDGGIWGRRIDRDSVLLGEQFRIGPPRPTTPVFERPAVAIDSDGDFAIAWLENASRLAPNVIFAQRFNAAGEPQGGAFTVNSPASEPSFSIGSGPEIAMDADGDFVIVWAARDPDEDRLTTFAQRYDALGVRQGNEIRVSRASTSTFFTSPKVAMDAAGNFIVVWQQILDGRAAATVQGQRFAADGTRQGDELSLLTPGPGLITSPVVAMDARGAFIVAVNRFENDAGPFGSVSLGIFAQRFTPHGRPWGKERRVSRADVVQARAELDVDMDRNGDFVVTWIANDSPSGGPTRFHLRLVSRVGVPLTGDRQFEFPEIGVGEPAVAMDGRGNFTVVWHQGTENPDGSGIGPNILAQRFAGPHDFRASCSQFIATQTGTHHSDMIRGTPGDDVIQARGGSDWIAGGAGDDIICGGAGADQLFGEDGNDRLRGGPGDDVLDGGPGEDFCDGQDDVNSDTAVQCESVQNVP